MGRIDPSSAASAVDEDRNATSGRVDGLAGLHASARVRSTLAQFSQLIRQVFRFYAEDCARISSLAMLKELGSRLITVLVRDSTGVG